MSLALSGIGVSRGVAIGKAHIIVRGSLEVLESAIPRELIEDEIARFLRAVDAARLQLKNLRDRIPQTTRVDIAAFIDTHLLMLDDATLVTTPVDLIRELGCNAEWALKLQRDAVVDVFEQMDDAYLRTRRDDVDHVINRVQRILMDDGGDSDQDVAIPLEGAIVLAYELTPAETVMLEHQGISAFATECGGPLSHTAILARSMQIPAMVGTHGLQRYIRDGETLLFAYTQNDTLQKRLRPGGKLIYSTFTMPMDKASIAGYAATEGCLLNIPDVYAIDSARPYRFSRKYDEEAGYETRSMISVPLKTARGDILGILQIINAQTANKIVVPFSDADESLNPISMFRTSGIEGFLAFFVLIETSK